MYLIVYFLTASGGEMRSHGEAIKKNLVGTSESASYSLLRFAFCPNTEPVQRCQERLSKKGVIPHLPSEAAAQAGLMRSFFEHAALAE